MGSRLTLTCCAFIILLTTTGERAHRYDDLGEESLRTCHSWSGITDQLWTSALAAPHQSQRGISTKREHYGQYCSPPLGASTGAQKQHKHQARFCLLSQYYEDGAC